MKLQLSRPVSILIIGAGGTGGYVIPHLYRIAYATKRKYRVVIADGDIVEKKNLIRQNFSEFDIGTNKAEAMAERYSETFGIETEYIPEYIEDEDMLCDLLIPKTNEARSQKPAYIIIGAVDNNRSRVMCHNVFNKLDDVIYIDSGNGEYTGQVVCGIKENGKVVSEPVASIFPDILTDTEKFPSELSCAERSVSAPQSIAANIFAATAISTMLYYLLAKGELETTKIAFSARKLLMKGIAQYEK
ncbi:MAG: ThiF family adenylyltransferase [Eubacteriales bacterium]|nr:ThiF family adenylyltransferase [Eubacteriales bacterium]